MKPLNNIEEEVRRLALKAQVQNIRLRVLGGLAIRLHCPSSNRFCLQRTYGDIDFITNQAGGQQLEIFFPANGYLPDRAFNTLNGSRRQLYHDDVHQRQIDIFVGEFEMCHRLPLADRLELETFTAPLAELFLSKAQIVELNFKDAIDLVSLLLDHPTGDNDEETINTAYIANLCSKDWGLYTTVELNLQRVDTLLQDGAIELGQEQKDIVQERLETILETNEKAPKTLAWKTRARIGKRVRWYLEVEEVCR